MQYVIVDSTTGLPVHHTDGQVFAVDLPEGAYAVEWLEVPVADAASGTPAIARSLFDEVIDCLYEYDLGQELSDDWPQPVRDAIEAARLRIMASR